MNSFWKKIFLVILTIVAIAGGVFGISKVSEIRNQAMEYCLYGCPTAKKIHK